MKKLVVAFLFLLPLLGLFAGSISAERALNIGREFFSSLTGNDSVACDIEAYRSSENQAADFYIIRFNPLGYLILAAEDKSTPILAYSLESSFPEGDMPPQVEWYLSEYSSGIEQIRKHPDWQLDPLWHVLETGNFSAYSQNRSVAPLLSTAWDQDWPYNSMCPADASGPGGRVYAGCVAVSMAQIMKKWGYPTTGNGTHSYNQAVYGVQTANFGATTYNWANMPNSIYTVNPSISTLMYHCGVAVDTQYGAAASGALSENVRDAMVNNFRFNAAAVYRMASAYTSTAWATMLRADLDLGRPVYYGGSNGSVGHSFVIDGYTGTNYFHINWGWSGSYNGNFYLTNLNPSSYNFNLTQAGIFNLYPLNTAPPNPPTNLIATEVANTVYITWSTVGAYSKIWRLTQGQETNEAAWVSLIPGTQYTTSFMDTPWSSFPYGTYMWAVKAVSAAGVSSIPAFSNPITKAAPMPLVSGWNLISLNLSPGDHAIAPLTSSISANLLQIKCPEGIYIPNNPFSTLSSFTNGNGYNMQMASAVGWAVSGSPIAASTPITLQDGWNLVAYLPQTPLSVANAVQSISNWLVQVKGTDGVYAPNNPYSTLTAMSPNKGYWIKIMGNHNLIYPSGTKDTDYAHETTPILLDK
ncbi:MAG: C10 family peptidase [Candidatus Cloacimonetes bacterium]|nr:C10 family peptidase [Candidatus Cloacimonadota bacterium]